MFKRYAALIALAVTVSVAAPLAQKPAPASKVTQPKDQFGFAIGDDYRLVNYTQYTDYLKKLQAQSERMIVTDIGKTEEGRTEFTAIITSPENQRKLPMIKAANRRLARTNRDGGFGPPNGTSKIDSASAYCPWARNASPRYKRALTNTALDSGIIVRKV